MMVCANCGEELIQGSRFCTNCGTKITNERFDIDTHLSNLQKNGFQVVNNKQKIETKKWSQEKYLDNIFTSIVAGGFTYFTLGEPIEETDFIKGVILKSREKMEVRKKNPILLDDEKLVHIGLVKRQGVFGGHGGTTIGPMYYTGRRFMLDTIEFETETHMGHEAEFSLPLTSYWIKPEFTQLMDKLNANYFHQEGVFRKKRYNKVDYTVSGIEKPGLLAERALSCGYQLVGDNRLFYDVYKQYINSLDENNIEAFSEKIEKMINDAYVTDVCNLITHTYTCKMYPDAIIETALAYGGKKLTEAAFSLCGLFGIIV